MGYLIGGAGDGAEEEIVESGKDYSKLSDRELLSLRDQTVKDVAKFNNFQMVRKICLNSAYGAVGNQYFRYFKLSNAEAITLSGQTSIRWIEDRLNKYLNDLLKTDNDYVIAVDTDSVYLNLGPLVDKFLSKQKDDKEKRMDWMLRGFRQFDAPVSLVLTYDKYLDPAAITHFGLGALAYGIVLAAWEHGVGCVINGQGIMQSDVVRKYAEIPDDQNIMICIAMGYPDEDFPANDVRSTRADNSKLISYIGFD